MVNGELIEKHEIIEDAPIEQVITDDFIAKFEKQAELYQNRYLPICLKLTNEQDWVNHGSMEKPKYSLQSSGAEKVCNPLGMTWERPIVTKREMRDDLGDYYEIEVEGVVTSKVLRRFGWFTGNCNSRDQFFIARAGGGKKPDSPEYDREKEIAARLRIDEGDIRKAAFSNWIVNAVTRLAGIRNPTPSMLHKAGLDPANIGKVDYSGRRTPEADSGKISEAQGKRLWALCKENNVAEPTLRAHLSEKYKLLSINDIPRGQYNQICAWVMQGGKEIPQP